MSRDAVSSDNRAMKSWLAMIVLLSIPALVAAQGSCANKAGARAERAAPAMPYPAWSHWVLVEPQFL